MTSNRIKTILIGCYEEVFQRPAPDEDCNLMSPSFACPVALYLYWMKKLDEDYRLPIYTVIEKTAYTDMTIRILTEMLYTEMSQRGEAH